MKELEKIKIPTTTGKNIAAAIHYPQKETEKLAILCPGNLDSKDYDHLVKLAEAFSEKGYTAVRFDPTGTWDSDGDESDYSNGQYLKDIQEVIMYMLAKKAYSRILLGGHSRGGMISILYAAQDQRISEVVAIMPPTSLTKEELKEEKYVNWKKNGFNLSTRDIPGSTERREYKLPYSHLLERLKTNVFDAVQKVQVPIIFIAGELDTITLPEDIKSIFDKANEPKKYILMPGIGHGYRRNLGEVEVVNKEILKNL